MSVYKEFGSIEARYQFTKCSGKVPVYKEFSVYRRGVGLQSVWVRRGEVSVLQRFRVCRGAVSVYKVFGFVEVRCRFYKDFGSVGEWYRFTKSSGPKRKGVAFTKGSSPSGHCRFYNFRFRRDEVSVHKVLRSVGAGCLDS